MSGFIYILYKREFIVSGENVYKIGRTTNIGRRIREYPEGSQLFFSIFTDNVKVHELVLIKQFSNDFLQRKDIGIEYFQGPVNNMMELVFKYIIANKRDYVDEFNIISNNKETGITHVYNASLPFHCKRCNYTTYVKCNLIKHLLTKKPCKELNKSLDRRQLINELVGCQKLGEKLELISLEKRIKNLEDKKIKNFEEERIKKNIKHKLLNTNTILNFGHEKIDHISNDVLFDVILKKDLDKLMQLIHFDINHPNNLTIRHKNRDYLEYYQNGWNVGPRKQVINGWLQRAGATILLPVFEIRGQDLQDSQEWLQAIGELKYDVVKEVRAKLYATILNQSNYSNYNKFTNPINYTEAELDKL